MFARVSRAPKGCNLCAIMGRRVWQVFGEITENEGERERECGGEIYSPQLNIERNEQKLRLALRNGDTEVEGEAINQDKLMINKLVGAVAPLLVLLSIVYLRTNYRPSQTPRANCRTVV